MFNRNFILNSDSYKMSHYLFYPEGTTEVYSYMESRGGKYPETLFFGMQGFLKEYLQTPITRDDIEYARDFAKEHGVPFNDRGWYHILNKHGGYMPVEIKAVKEGSIIPTRNVLATVVNTDPEVPFITSYIETMALRLWYPITVATRSYTMKKKIKPYFDLTSDSGNMDFGLLDFGARGCTSYESNQIAGAAHLINFIGSDSMAAIDYVKQMYGGKIEGYSVPATEHSIMCAYGHENELESFERIIDQAPVNGIISVVSDTWNIFEACKKWVTLQEMLQNKNLTLVIRPDSGDIEEVLTEVIREVSNGFGYQKNEKGYDVLNGVKILWGDGMNEDTIDLPFKVAESLRISSDSIITGSGGGLLQAGLDRDTNKFAFKASNVIVDGVSIPIAKDPITDHGKQSKKGKMILKHTPYWDSKYFTYTEDNHPTKMEMYKDEDELQLVYRNGVLFNETTMSEIRERVNNV